MISLYPYNTLMSCDDSDIQVLRDAEVAVARMSRAALDRGQYAEAAKLASLANGLGQVAQLELPSEKVLSMPVVPTSQGHAGTARSQRRVKKYPRYERDGNRLVKIGWSKKKRKKYLHKADVQIVVALVEKIRADKGEDVWFTAPEILPINIEGATESVPNYQSYLALAWLRFEGIIAKQGRDSYLLKSGSPSGEELVELFTKLTPHA